MNCKVLGTESLTTRHLQTVLVSLTPGYEFVASNNHCGNAEHISFMGGRDPFLTREDSAQWPTLVVGPRRMPAAWQRLKSGGRPSGPRENMQ